MLSSVKRSETWSRNLAMHIVSMWVVSGDTCSRPYLRVSQPKMHYYRARLYNTACTRLRICAAFFGSFHNLKLFPAKWRSLVPEEHRDRAQSHPPVASD